MVMQYLGPTSQRSHNAELISPKLDIKTASCLDFQHFVKGKLTVKLMYSELKSTTIMTSVYRYASMWHSSSVDVPVGEYQLDFETTFAATPGYYSGINNIVIKKGVCKDLGE